MTTFTLELSAARLSAILPGQRDFEFTFYTDSGRYTLPVCLVRFLSPKLERLVDADDIEDYTVETRDPQKLFPNFLELSHGRPITATSVELLFYMNIALELENDELVQKIATLFPETLSYDTVIESLIIGLASGKDTSRQLTFIVTNLVKLPWARFDLLTIDQLHAIVGDPRAPRDDALMTFIENRVQANPEAISLLDYVDLDQLGDAGIRALETIGEGAIGRFPRPLWDQICARLAMPSITSGGSRAKPSRVKA
jgi:hypothetical protein